MHTHRQTDIQTETDRHKRTQTDTGRQRQTKTDRQRQSHNETDRSRPWQTVAAVQMAALWFYHFWLVARGDENIPDRRRVAVVSVWRTQRGISLVERAQECPTLAPPPLPSCVAQVTWWGESESNLPQDDMEMVLSGTSLWHLAQLSKTRYRGHKDGATAPSDSQRTETDRNR